MIEPLSETQQRWVEATFTTLRAEDKVAQLLIPTLGAYDYRREAVDAFLADRTLGGIFVGMADRDQHREEIAKLQARGSIPLVVTKIVSRPMPWRLFTDNDLHRQDGRQHAFGRSR